MLPWNRPATDDDEELEDADLFLIDDEPAGTKPPQRPTSVPKDASDQKKKTSVTMDLDIHTRFRIHAAVLGVSGNDLMVRYIMEGLDRDGAEKR